MSIRVLLVDDQALVRTGFRMILESEPGIEVVGEAEDGAEAIAAIADLRPDVALMDIQMPVMDGLEATRRIVRSESASTRVVILTTFERDEYIFEALRGGASGFLLKNSPPEDLIAAVRVVAGGDSLLAPSITRRIIEQFAARPLPSASQEELDLLTQREVEVLKHMAKGMTNVEVAEDLVIGEATVKTHVSNILAKLGLRDRIQAVVFAYESGLIQPGGG